MFSGHACDNGGYKNDGKRRSSQLPHLQAQQLFIDADGGVGSERVRGAFHSHASAKRAVKTRWA
jgi:hypothetical protein